MTPEVVIYTTPPQGLIKLLSRSHPLLTLPLVRRLQFASRFPGGITEHAKILWCSGGSLNGHHYAAPDAPVDRDDGEGVDAEAGNEVNAERGENGENGEEEVPFAAAYLDFSRGPETELWIYSSMEARLARTKAEAEDREDEDADAERGEMACIIALLRQVKRLQDLYFLPGSPEAAEREFPTILVGNLNEAVRERLVAAGLEIISTGLYDKWVFETDRLPDVGLPEVLGSSEGPGEGKRWGWDVVRKEDILFTISRTKIPRRERTMKLLPSTALYLDDGTPIAWAFLGNCFSFPTGPKLSTRMGNGKLIVLRCLGPDSSLSSLHCEPLYRGRGIAKAVAVRVLKDHLRDYGEDARYGWADVAPDNLQSQGVCRSLNGQVKWQISWSRLNLDQSFPDE
ncbi:hypothetical protein F5Y03DRAFT_390867 [Xylaria venustula]|nr:hypothetical protein F5Y03DRAFT_390867 [Xylaria venustula]